MNEPLHKQMSLVAFKGKLVDAERLLVEVFEPECRPSIRWLRAQTKAKTIPYVKIGHLVFFDVDMVRAALAARNLRKHRGWGRPSDTHVP